MSLSISNSAAMNLDKQRFAIGERLGVGQEFPYIIDIERNSLPWTYTEWCNENCTGLWGWWFDVGTCYVGFTMWSDACWFCLKFKGETDQK